MSVTSNAVEVADRLDGAAVTEAQAEADAAAAELALTLIRPDTPVDTGALLAGLDAIVIPEGGFAVVDAVPYAAIVDARTGFATDNLAAAEDRLAELYEDHLQDTFDRL